MTFEREIDRTISFKNSQGAEVRGTLSQLSRRTVVFEVYNPYSVVQLSEVLSDVNLRRGHQRMFQGDAVVTGLVSTGIMAVISATLIGRWSDLWTRIGDKEAIGTEIEQFVADWEKANKLVPSYQLSVADLRSFLIDLSLWLDQIEVTREEQTGTQSGISDETFWHINKLIEPKLSSVLIAFENASREVAQEDVDVHKLLVYRDLHPLLLAAPFFNRVFRKPLGYAGDYEMVNMILRRTRDGPTTYAQIVNDWFLAGGPPTAHRNRIDILESRLRKVAEQSNGTERKIRILNIGCGPAVELQRFVASHDLAGQCAFRLMDFNAETLRYAELQISKAMAKRVSKPDIEYELRSVNELLRAAVKAEAHAERYDFIYCAGLFDYIGDRICSKLIKFFFEWVDPGGKVLVTNVHSDHYAQGIMEHLMEWYLVLRNEQDMLGLVPNLPNRQVYTDDTGINVFLEIDKPFA